MYKSDKKYAADKKFTAVEANIAYAILVDENSAQHKYTSMNNMCWVIISRNESDISTVTKNATAGIIANRVSLAANK